MTIEPFLDALARWAAGQADIVALALVGSHARGAATPQSDVDVVIVTSDPPRYFDDPAWAGQFGEMRSAVAEDWGRIRSLRVFYAGAPAAEVEYGFGAPDWAGVPVDAGTRRVVGDGMRILYDPAGLLRALQEACA